MIRTLISRGFCTFAQKNTQKLLSIQRINKCRQVLKMGQNTKKTLEQCREHYLIQRSLIFIDSKKIDLDMLIGTWQELKPIDCQVTILAQSKIYSQTQKKYVSGIFRFWGVLFLIMRERFQKSSQVKCNQYRKAVKDVLKAFNQLLYLMHMDEGNIIVYLKVLQMAYDMKLYKESSSPRLKYIFDEILNLPSIRGDHLGFLFYFLSWHRPSIFYHERSDQLMEFLFSRLPNNFMSDENEVIVKNLVYCLSKIHNVPQKIRDKVPELLSHRHPTIRLQSLNVMFQELLITKDNIQDSKYISYINEFVQKKNVKIFGSLFRNMYRAQIWIPQFWKPFFQFMKENNNYKMIAIIDLHIIYDLLQNGDGGEQLKKISYDFNQFLIKKGVDITNINFKEQSQKVFGKKQSSKFSLQSQIANTFKLLGQVEVLSQAVVKCFIVDLLIDKKIVVEVNNIHHYKLIDGQYKLNLKSQFRQRVLQRHGYIYHNIMVKDYIETPSFMLQEIKQLIENYLKQKKLVQK